LPCDDLAYKGITDVINVSGHRLSTSEIESALIMHNGVAETAGKFFTPVFRTLHVSMDFIAILASGRYFG
jgi:hypothetical protein